MGHIVSDKLKKKATKAVGKTSRSEKNLVFVDLRGKSYPDGNAIVSKRKDELRKIWNILGKRRKRNLVIVGDSGTGRSQLIAGIAQHINTGNCPERFKNSHIFEVPVERQFCPATNDFAKIVAGIVQLFAIARHFPETIIYFDSFEKLMDYQILDLFQPIFDSAVCIAMLDLDAYERFDEVKYNFTSFMTSNPERDDIYPLVKGSLRQIEKFHNNVRISKEAFNQILNESLLSKCNTNIANVLDIADEAASVAENRGMEVVDIRCILETNRSNIDKMLKRSKEVNRFSAVHEAGHAIVALYYGLSIDAISIIPYKDGIGGFNLFEVNNNPLKSREDIKRKMEIDLGGYAGMLIEGNQLSNGASGDLIKVSKNARAMYLYWGMEENHPISYLNDNRELELTYMSEEMKTELNQKVSSIIQASASNAHDIIDTYRPRFLLIASALEKKGYLTKKEVLGLYEGTMRLEDISKIEDIIFEK